MSTHASPSRVALAALLALFLAAPGPAAGAPPSPLDSGLFAFPGAFDHPFSAFSASVALADAWLGDDPCGNPAVTGAGAIRVSPALVRVSRQDLRADNRNYDETPAFVDGASASIVGNSETIAGFAYVCQPVVRLEDNAYSRGTGSVNPGPPPAVIQSATTMREIRAGIGIAPSFGPVRFGAAIEYTWRDDEYELLEESGSPESGLRHVEFSGEGIGASFGASWRPAGRVAVAGSARLLAALDLEGEQRLELFSGDSVAAITGKRHGTWEGGVSARIAAAEGLAVLVGLGARAEEVWVGLDSRAGPCYQGAVGLDYRLPESDWSVRFGLGHEQQTDVPEPRAMRVALGVGWDLDGMILDFGVVRRSFHHGADSPISYDDRILLTARFDF